MKRVRISKEYYHFLEFLYSMVKELRENYPEYKELLDFKEVSIQEIYNIHKKEFLYFTDPIEPYDKWLLAYSNENNANITFEEFRNIYRKCKTKLDLFIRVNKYYARYFKYPQDVDYCPVCNPENLNFRNNNGPLVIRCLPNCRG